MTHETLKELVLLSYDRELSPADQAEVEKHLPGCPECRAALASWKENAPLLFSASTIDNPESFVQSVMQRIETKSSKSASLPLKLQTLLAGIKASLAPRRLVLAGTAALALSALFMSHPFRTQPQSPEAAIEYASDLMEGPFVYAEKQETDSSTAIEDYFL